MKSERLRDSERQFCAKHGIPEARLFDAAEMKPADYKRAMLADEKWAASACGHATAPATSFEIGAVHV